MKLITKEQERKLLRNGQNRDQDHEPVVKIFNPYGKATWLLNELDPDNPDHGFGLCDLGQGCPELGYVSISELTSMRHPQLGMGLERDRHFKATAPLSAYTKAAQQVGHIVDTL